MGYERITSVTFVAAFWIVNVQPCGLHSSLVVVINCDVGKVMHFFSIGIVKTCSMMDQQVLIFEYLELQLQSSWLLIYRLQSARQ